MGCPVGVGAPTHTCANQPKELQLSKIKIKPSFTISNLESRLSQGDYNNIFVLISHSIVWGVSRKEDFRRILFFILTAALPLPSSKYSREIAVLGIRDISHH